MWIDLFLIGLCITLEPIPITGMILLLAAERGLLKGLGYLVGWVATLGAIVAGTVLITGGKPLIPESKPSTVELVAKLVIGVILVGIAYRRRGRRSAAPKQAKWMTRVNRISPLGAAGLAFFLQPWVLTAAGVATITEANVTTAEQRILLVLFCLLSTASLLAMETFTALRPEAVKEKLAALLEWITTHRDQAIVFLSLGLGLYLMARSIYGLVR